MANPAAMQTFLLAEVEALEPFDFVAVLPTGRPLHIAEVTRLEGGELDVRVPGRPRALPQLEDAHRSALQDRGFASENAADPTIPWTRRAADPEAAVSMLRELHVEIFGEKPDATFDVAHGSHRIEHESRKKLAVAHERVESIVTEIVGKRAERDEDGDWVLPIANVHVMVSPRSTPTGHVVIRVFAITNVGISVTPELGLFLARLNFGLAFGRFALDAENRSIWFDDTLLGESFREEELRFAVEVVAETADGWDDRLKQMFGGATYQEVLAGRAAETAPKTKPGSGTGLYL